MTPSLRALLSSAVDYAGLFPPAKLPLEQAFHNYLAYRRSDESWMLGRFVCPAERLPELAHLLSPLEAAVEISALGRGSEDLQQDLDTLFKAREGRRFIIDVFEVRFPVDAAANAKELAGVVTTTVAMAEPPPALFVEAAGGRSQLEAVIQSIQQVRGTRSSVGFKLRCGGLDASAFPAPEQMAYVIAACRDHAVPLKLTAGLHHPIRKHDAQMKTHMHGFINVFVAGVLAHARKMNEPELAAILRDDNPASFVFDASQLSWREHTARWDEIGKARQQLITSFGSCSFDEPRDDLAQLGWL